MVVDLSLAINPSNLPITLQISDETYGQAVKEYICRFIDQRLRKLVQYAQGKDVRGMILMNHDIRQQFGGGWAIESTTIATDLSPYNDRRRRGVERFFKQFMKGLPTFAT